MRADRFVCLVCGEAFDFAFSLEEPEDPDVRCPRCRSTSLECLVTTCQFVDVLGVEGESSRS